MKGIARAVFVILGLVLVGTGLYLLAVGVNLMDGGALLESYQGVPVLAVVGAGLIVIGVAALSLGLYSSQGKAPASILQTSEYGEIRISIVAIENMVLRVVQQTQGIKDNGRKASYSPDGMIIYVKIKVMPDLEIPSLVGELQGKIKSYLEDITGLLVHEVKVMVENIILDQAPAKRNRPV